MRSASMAPAYGTRSTRAYIALGANLGDRIGNLQSALRRLDESPATHVVAISGFVETEPVGPPGQGPYLNAAAAIDTALSARELLDLCLDIERAHGRDRRTQARWGPRQLDLDLLLYGDKVIDEPGLSVPHPRMAERLFVLVPLAEIASQIVHPVLNMPVGALLTRLQHESRTEYAPPSACSKDG